MVTMLDDDVADGVDFVFSCVSGEIAFSLRLLARESPARFLDGLRAFNAFISSCRYLVCRRTTSMTVEPI